MNPSQNPYSPPHALVQDSPQSSPARPRIVVLLVYIYLAAFPLFAWRVSLGGRMQSVALVFWLIIFGLYAIGIAFALLKGKRWARFLVLGFSAIWLCTLLLSVIRTAWQPGSVWDIRAQIYAAETLLKTSVAVLLLLPASRNWFARRSTAKPTRKPG